MKGRPYAIAPIHAETYQEWSFKSGHTLTSSKQKRVIAALVVAGRSGMTSRELANIHAKGDVTGTSNWGAPFSVLHQRGIIEKLERRRNGYGVYVLPGFVEGRATKAPYRHGEHCPGCRCG